MPSDATVAPAPAAFRLPLSEAQRDIWTAHTLDPTGLKYNVGECREVLGPVDPVLMGSAWRRLVEEADVMRTLRFEDDGETVWQLIDAEPGARSLPFTDVSDADDPEGAAWSLVDAAIGTPFDLTRESPVRCALIKLAEERYFYFYGFHHLLVDGVSVSMLLKRLVELYEKAVAGEPWDGSPFGRLADLHAEDAAWRGSEEAVAERASWREHLAGAQETPASLVRGTGRAVPARGALPFARRTVLVPAQDADRLRAVARAERVSWPVLVIALFSVYLHRVTSQDELMLALPVTGRTTKAARMTPGMTSNVVPLRLRVSAEETLATLVRSVSAEVKHGLRHQLTRYEDLRRDARLRTGTRGPAGPVLNIMGFNADMEVCGHPTVNHNVSNGPVEDLSVAVYDLGASGGLRIDFDTPADGVDTDAVAAHQDRFVTFLATALAPAEGRGEPADRRVAELEVLSEAERELLLGTWAGAVADRDDVSLVERFEEQVTRAPDAVALIDGERRITYGELNADANRWAHHLRSQGLGRGDLAGILLERGATFATAVIAVLKTGAGHVLLDPDFPDERLRSAANEASITHLVTRTALADRLKGTWTTSVEGPDDLPDHSPANPGLPIQGDDLACVMFTSGSTGRPKGILSSHRNLVSTLVGQTYLPTSPDEVFLQSSPVSWDAFSLEFWGPLLHGARVVLQPGQKPEPALIAELARRHRVTTLLLSASLFNYLTDEHPETFTSVTTAYTVGEAASPAHVHRLQQSHPGIRVINGYGPAEAMIYATTHTIEPTDEPPAAIPIGSPLTNKPLYVLDTALRLCAPGTTGELYVAGDGLAHGYLNRPELTATHFVPNPYGPPGTRLYRTGDLAHFDHHGNLHYQGRADNQIKIRGFRIEPAEVETALLTHPHITQATLTTHNNQLAAYIVTHTPTPLDDIRHHLTTRLPEHLIPTHITPLDKLPLTPNGKIDTRALPEPAALMASTRAPRTQLEEIMLAFFGRVLDTTRPVGVDDSFFTHGGHSLLAARLTNHIADELGVRLTIRDVFQHPTPARLAQHISTLKGRPALPPLTAGTSTDGNDTPLSYAQRRLWLLAELDGESTAYNVPMAVHLEGPLDADTLETALNDVIGRHAPLRTVFTTADGEPRQHVLPAAQARVRIKRRASTPETLDDDLAAAARHRFDLRTDTPLLATLFRLGDGRAVLHLLVHHIATDGRSTTVFFDDLSRAYEARAAGAEGQVLEPLQVRYADYAVWQQRALGSADDTESVLSQQLAFWRDTLEELPEEHTLNLDRPRPAQASHRGGQVDIALEEGLFQRIGALARTEGCTPFMVVHAALVAALTRLGAGSDLAIGTPVAGRTDEALHNLVGFFVNTLVLRTRTTDNPTFRGLLEHVRTTDLDAFAHQDAPFDLVLDTLNPARTLSRHPLFQICLTLETGAPVLGLPGVRPGPVQTFANGSAKFDLEFLLRSDDGQGLCGTVLFAEDLFDHATVQRMVTVLGEVLRQAVADPDRRLAHFDVVSAGERELLLGPWAGSVAAVDDVSLVERFEEQVTRAPEAVALIDGERRITYGELNADANRWAHHLRSQGLGRGDLAGILLERGATFATAVIAVLKTGAGYTLLDPDFPDERLRAAAEDAGISLLLTDDTLGLRAEGPWTLVSCSSDTPAGASDADLDLPIRGDDVACVMFTSGSTGRPKGILSSHRNLVSTLTAQTHGHFGPGEIFLQCSPVSWDAFSLEFWGALIHGGTTVLQPGQKPEPALITQLAQQHGVTMLQLSASLFNYLTEEHPDAFTTVTTTYTGGETASPTHIHQLHRTAPHTTIINGYGPAESMGFTTTHTIQPTDQPPTTIPIGTPLTNKAAHILDTTLQPAPPGVTGHLYLTGHGLAHGYLNQPHLTATHFVPNPYGPPGTRLYRTGDLAHFDHHGNLHYQGRADNQIKIRGFRIEPAEIETALLTHPHITQATLTTHNNQLAAYIVTHTPTPLDDIRHHLTTRLPEHLIPTHITPLDKLPLTPNGKIDTRALPEPLAALTAARAPRTQLEEIMLALFNRVLGTTGSVGVDDSFFTHGGHSLLAARLTNHIAVALDVRLTIRDVFQHPTPARLAQHISTLKGRPALPPLTAGTSTDDNDTPLSFAQRRLWLLAELDGNNPAYNVPMAIHLEGPLDADTLETALNDVVERHTPLRTVFTTVEGEPRQHVLAAEYARVTVERREVAGDELAEAMAGSARHVFDLRNELPLKATLFRVGDGSWVFFLLVHHIATDGRSTTVFFDDLSRAYEARAAGAEGQVLEQLQVRYADYAVWQQRALGSADDTESVLSQELAFWRDTLEELPEEHTLNLDRPRPAQASHRGGQVDIALEEGLFQRIGALARTEGCTPFMVVHAALVAALTRLGAGSDLAIGTPVAGRTDEALHNLVGFFVNTLVLRTRTTDNPTFRGLLEHVRTTDLDAFAHQDAPFDLVLDTLNPARTLSRHPLFQICLTLETGGVPGLRLGETRVAGVTGLTSGAAKFDLEFLLRSDDGQGLCGTVLFAEDLFDHATVQRMVTVLGEVLRQAVADPDRRLAHFDVVSAGERELLLGPWAGSVADIGDASLVGRFEEQVTRAPEAVALIDGERRITYGELNADANRWAHHLRSQGLGRGDLAGILLERGATFATAVIAVLKTGAGHVLLDPDFPDERLRSAANEASITHLVTRTGLAGRLKGPWTTSVEGPDDVLDHSPDNPGLPIRGDDVACVMFTSGSTGRPKGILSSHRNLVSTLTAQTHGHFGPGEIFLQCSPVSWDAFSLEFWGALIHGGTTVLQPGQKPEPALITQLAQQHGVTMLQLSASLFNYLTEEHPDAFTTVTTTYTGGETASPTHIHQLHRTAPHTTIINGYGPAESMGFTTTHTIQPTDQPPTTIPIGTPLTNKAAHILDTTLQPTPPGVTGHLYLTGHGLAHGYLNQPHLTATHFVPNPYGPPGTRLYRTGDLAHFDHHGNLHYQGRADNQIKIRGFRIEPAEIETALLTHPHITQATLTTHNNQLAAYIVTHTPTPLDDIRHHLTTRLPEHLIPTHITPLDKLPLTPNGKIDTRALPEPLAIASGGRAPRTPLEETLVALFTRALGVDAALSIDDDFFHHGGHSLLGARLTNHIAVALDVRLTVRDVFQHPTPARLAAHISTLQTTPAKKARPTLRRRTESERITS